MATRIPWGLALGSLLLLLASNACSDSDSEACEPGSCSAAETCNPDTGRCEPLPTCDSDEDCSSGRCVEGICSSCEDNLLCTGASTVCGLEGCTRCLDSRACAAPLGVCTASGCRSCAQDRDCPSSAPRCIDSRCAACRTAEDCPSGQSCHPSGFCTKDCTSDSECPASAPHCVGTGRCVPCRDDADCGPMQGCYASVCGPALPGDTCKNPVELDLRSGSVLVQGDIAVDYSQEDLYYRLLIPSEAALNADLTATGLGPDVALDLFQDQCPVAESFATSGFQGGHPQLRDVYLAAGTYLLRVRQENAGTVFSGPFTLRLWLIPKTRAVGNSCLKPIAIPLDASGNAVLTGTTVGIFSAAPDNCDGVRPAQPSMIYQLDLPRRSHVSYTVTPKDPAFDLEVEWTRSCFSLDSPSCTPLPEPGAAESAAFGPVDAGRHFIVVKSVGNTTGPYELSVRVTPWATNDTCETAQELTFSGDVATARGDTRFAGSEQCACSLMQCNQQQAYRFSTRGMGSRSLQVVLEAPPGGSAPQAAVVSQCGVVSSENVLACEYRNTSATTLVEVPHLAEGDYFLQVAQGSGPFTLTARLGTAFPAPANDACTAPTPLNLSSNPSITLTGDTRGAANDRSGTCEPHPDPGEGSDVVYEVTAPARGTVSFTVTPAEPTFDPVLRLHNDCPSYITGTRACMNAGNAGAGETVRTRLDSAGPTSRFFAWVDGAARTRGTFQLSAQYTPPPGNDTCGSGLPALSVGTPVSGDTSLAYNHTPCGNVNGPDVFYTFTPSANGSYRFTLTPTGFDGALLLLGSCTATTCTGSANTGGVGAPETLTVSLTRNTPYVLAVESAYLLDGGGGPFQLAVEAL